MTGVFIRRGNKDTEAHTQGGQNMKVEAEMRVRPLHAKECQRVPANTQSWGKTRNTFFLMAPRRKLPCQYLDLNLKDLHPPEL